MSKLSDLELQAEQLNRGVEELYYGEEWPSGEEVRRDAIFHVLFNEEDGPVQQEEIAAASFDECERELQRRHPTATYWEIGI